jgi:predicted PurR-regulated permease PerM
LLLLGSTLLITVGVWLRGTEISAQVDQLQQKLPIAMRQLIAMLPNFSWGRWLIRHGADSQQFPRLIDVVPKVTGFLSTTLGLILGPLLVAYVGITLAAEPETYRKGIERLFTPDQRPRVNHVLDQIEQNLRRWLIARAVSMCGVGLLVTTGLYILHVPLAGTLGIFAAAMTFIPNLGPVLSVIPPALLAFANSPKQAVWVLILFGLAHAIEGWLLTPLAERTVVRLPPALTLSSQLLLALVAGPIGVALAAPLTVLAIVLARTLYVERIENEAL